MKKIKKIKKIRKPAHFNRKRLKEKLNHIYLRSKNAINEHIWLELLFMVALALLVSGMVFLLVSYFTYSTNIGTREHVTYEESRNYIQTSLLQEVSRLNELDTEESKEAYENRIQDILENIYFSHNYIADSQTYLVDGTGKLMYSDGIVQSLDLIKVIQKINNNSYDRDTRNKFVAIYPVIIKDQVCYLYNESTLQPFYHKEFTDLGNILAFMAATGMFILIIFRLTRNKIAYIEYLSTCLREISKGNLDYQIEIVGEDELAQVARSITHMENELKYQIEAQVKTEKSKNELVTNVAHDLRTPLTSIIGYIGLVKSKGYKTQEEADKYLEIAYNKSEKLKVIIEDLFELTKLHQHSVQLNQSKISMSNLLHQLIEELMPLAHDKKVEIETYIDTHDTNIYVDITKMTRVFENLIENAIKYCPEEETVYVELRSMKSRIYVAVSNLAENISKEEIEKFFERFYRADQSRNSSAGGSGLGLAIAKNIVELHGGTIKAELNQDLICFKVILPRGEV